MSKEVRYVSHSEAVALRARFQAIFVPDQAISFKFGQVGCREVEYYEVDDDDPRLQSPEPVCDTKSPT